jgi:hypothetical protein
MMFVPHWKHSPPLPGNGESFTVLYVDDVRTSLEAQAFTVCYRDSFTLLYVDDVRTSLEAHASTACYGDSFTVLYIDDVRTSLEAQASTACYRDSLLPFDVDETILVGLEGERVWVIGRNARGKETTRKTET